MFYDLKNETLQTFNVLFIIINKGKGIHEKRNLKILNEY